MANPFKKGDRVVTSHLCTMKAWLNSGMPRRLYGEPLIVIGTEGDYLRLVEQADEVRNDGYPPEAFSYFVHVRNYVHAKINVVTLEVDDV